MARASAHRFRRRVRSSPCRLPGPPRARDRASPPCSTRLRCCARAVEEVVADIIGGGPEEHSLKKSARRLGLVRRHPLPRVRPGPSRCRTATRGGVDRGCAVRAERRPRSHGTPTREAQGISRSRAPDRRHRRASERRRAGPTRRSRGRARSRQRHSPDAIASGLEHHRNSGDEADSRAPLRRSIRLEGAPPRRAREPRSALERRQAARNRRSRSPR